MLEDLAERLAVLDERHDDRDKGTVCEPEVSGCCADFDEALNAQNTQMIVMMQYVWNPAFVLM